MPSGESPSLGSWLSLNITLGCLGHPQSQALSTSYSIVHRIFTQNLKTSQHKTQQKTRKLRQYKKIKPPLRYCNELIINSYWCNIYCTQTYLWFIPFDTTHRLIKISKQHIENRICKKNRTVCSNLYQTYTSGTPKILQNQEVLRNSCTNQDKKELDQNHVSVN